MYVYVHVRLYSCDRFLVPLHIAHCNHSCNYILLEQRGHVNPNDIRHVKLRRCSHTKITSVMQCALWLGLECLKRLCCKWMCFLILFAHTLPCSLCPTQCLPCRKCRYAVIVAVCAWHWHQLWWLSANNCRSLVCCTQQIRHVADTNKTVSYVYIHVQNTGTVSHTVMHYTLAFLIHNL